MAWSRGAINAFLANGGDIRAVDRFLRRGGRIASPKDKIKGAGETIGYAASGYGRNYHFGTRFVQYVEDSEEARLTRSTGGVLHDDYSEESFP